MAYTSGVAVKPIVYDLFCGLGGWSEAFIAEGYEVIGFDIEAHDYGNGGYPGKLVLRDVRSISGAVLVKEFGVPVVIVASPPCQEFSYMAMPWSRAKEKQRKIEADPEERVRLCDLFNQCFRIRREISQAAGHYVPMVVENVRGAQKWVGKARWNFGSFYLWGDVPAFMPIPAKLRIKHDVSCAPILFKDREPSISLHQKDSLAQRNAILQKPTQDALAARYAEKGEGNKTAGMNWSDQMKRGQDFTRIAGRQAMEGLKLPGNNSPRRWEEREVKRLCDAGQKTTAHLNQRDGHTHTRHLTNPIEHDAGIKQAASITRRISRKSSKRKQASAEIAKIPKPLATWIAKCFKPIL